MNDGKDGEFFLFQQLDIASRFVDGGYVLELAIPLTNFPGLTEGREGAVIRFFTSVTDRDVLGAKEDKGGPVYSERKQALHWYETVNPGVNSVGYTALVFVR